MITVRNPPGRPEPSSYHHAVEVVGPARTLYIAGQIGMSPDGSIPDGIEAQARLAFANLDEVLRGGSMRLSDVVKTTVFLTRPEDRDAFAAIRAEITGGVKNASTLVFVAGLALPKLLVEIEAIAVRPIGHPFS